MNGNNNFGGRKKKKGNGAILLVAAIPVVLCVVMAAMIFSFTNKANDDFVTQDYDSAVTDPLKNADNSPTDDALTSAEGDTQNEIPMPDEVPSIPEEPDKALPEDSLLPEERPDSPVAPEIPDETDNKANDGLLSVDLDAWNLVLVNPWTYLPEGFSVELSAYNDAQKVDARIMDDLKAMVSDMKKQGLSPVICSSYRTMEKQTTLYNNQVAREKAKGLSDEEARREAGMAVAVPGTSEHHTGLAIDIVALSYQILDTKQEETAEQKWLLEHCYDYGFILRYPNGKSDITGIIYEPWHYRYVGKEVAADIKARGITFEEWLDLYK